MQHDSGAPVLGPSPSAGGMGPEGTPPDGPSGSAPSGAGLIIEGLRKAYGATQALDALALTAVAGRIVGVVGPNGAGKSTLVKILAGEEREDAGTVMLNGRRLAYAERRRSVAVVHQEPQLFPNLSVAENLLIDERGVRRPRPRRDVLALLEDLQLGRVAKAPLEATSIVVWQLTEIARALVRNAEVFLFDEPNSALTHEESEQLFAQMARLRDDGKLVLLVSHRLSEVAQLCGEVAVVRDGNVVAVVRGAELSSDRLSSLLIAEEFGRSGATSPGAGVGAPPGATPPDERTANGALLEAAGDTSPSGGGGEPAVAVPAQTSGIRPRAGSAPSVTPGRRVGAAAADGQVPVEAAPGRIVAVTGPEGGGGRELTRAARLPPSPERPAAGAGGRSGRAYMPSDRRQSLFFNMSVAANISVRLAHSQLAGSRLLTRQALETAAASYIERFSIKAAHAGAAVGSLSGGNQQKVALASALAVDPALLIVEEPTRGVDVRTKLQIYEILGNYARSGGAVVMFVTELEDAIGCAEVLYVVSEGIVRGEIDVPAAGDLEQLGFAVNALLARSADAA